MGFLSRTRTKTTDSDAPVLMVHLAARLQPVHRGSVYEDPLDELLAEHAPGSAVVGGGTEVDPVTGPRSASTEVRLVGDPGQTAAMVVDMLEYLGAPIGSHARLGSMEPLAFGVTHGFNLVVPTSPEPDADVDLSDLVAALQGELGEAGRLQSWWDAPDAAHLYVYGRDPEQVRTVLEAAEALSPLARGSRVEAIT